MTTQDGVPGTELPAREEHASMRVYSTDALFGGSREIAIRHADVYYRLRITRQGKLILNK